MNNRNIVLVGFMGAGKSIVSKRLATALGRERVSTDDIVEYRERRRVSEIFTELGESYFRNVEAGVVSELVAREKLVIDCGGGVVLNERNVISLQQNGTLFYLRASPSVIYKRVRNEGERPLLDVPHPLEKITALLAQRELLYEKADYTIEVDALSVDGVVQEIVALFNCD